MDYKKIGKIYNFDGVNGFIITTDEEYLLTNKELKKDENYENGDIVYFIPSTIKFGNEITKIARHIEKKYTLSNQPKRN